jgi:hypothetical protein
LRTSWVLDEPPPGQGGSTNFSATETCGVTRSSRGRRANSSVRARLERRGEGADLVVRRCAAGRMDGGVRGPTHRRRGPGTPALGHRGRGLPSRCRVSGTHRL